MPAMLLPALRAALMLVLAEPTAADAEARLEAAAFLQRGNEAFRARDFLAAAEEYEQGHRRFPSPKLLYNLGKAYDGARLPARALDAFQRFLDTLPSEPQSVRHELSDRAALARARVTALRAELGPTPAPALLPPAPPPIERAASRPPLSLDGQLPPVTPALATSRWRWWAVGAGVVIVGVTTAFIMSRSNGEGCPRRYAGCL